MRQSPFTYASGGGTETVQDIVGAMLVDSATIDFSYNDVGGTETAVIVPASVDVSTFLSFVSASRLAGRGPTGTATEISVDGTSIEFNGAGLRRSAFAGGDVTGAAGSAVLTIPAGTVTYSKMADVSGLSVMGRASNSSGVPASITAATDGHALRLNGTTLGFGTLALGAFADTIITPAKLNVSANVLSMLNSASNAAIRSNIGAVNIAGDTMTGALSVTGTVNATVTAAGAAATFTSTDAGASAFRIELFRDSASPAAADDIADISFFARDSAANKQIMARIRTTIDSATDGAESAHFEYQVIQAGTTAARFRVGAGVYDATLTDQGAGTVNFINTYTNNRLMLDSNGVVRRRVFTVGTLPTGVTGGSAYVSDALAPTFGATVAGSGAVGVPVYYDGSNWKVG